MSENAPKIHSRATHFGIDLPGVLPAPAASSLRCTVLEQVTGEQIENLFEQITIAMNVLNALQHGRDIIAGLGVQFDIIDINLAQEKVRVFGNSHGSSRSKITANRTDRAQKQQSDPIFDPAEFT